MLQFILWAFSPIIDYVAINYRPLAMITVVLPMSFLASIFVETREKISQLLLKRTTHDERVERVQKNIRERLLNPDKRPMCTARAAWQNLSTRFASYKENSDCIFIADFNNVLSIDKKNGTVTLEPLVSVDKITKYLLPRGFMLATTLEIKEATIGGLAMAVGMTTASHKYGLLSETVLEYKVALGNGEIVTVTKDNEYSDLFYGIPWSHGSLCLLLSLKMKIIPVKPWVELTYTPITSGMKDYCSFIREVSLKDEPADFVEAQVFDRKHAVILTANFIEAPIKHKGDTNYVGLWYKPWFYTQVRDKLKNGNKSITVEYIPTYDYIFRHDRSIFFTLDDQLPEKYGNHPLFRYFLGWLCPPKIQFLKLPATKQIKKEMMTKRVYQDIILPVSVMEESIELAGNMFEIWPILIYPSRIYDHGKKNQGLFRCPVEKVKGKNYGMYNDLGVYGIPRDIKNGKKHKTVTYMRKMEEFTRRVGGAPFLYADTFMDENEFKEMFDLKLYEKLRVKYKAEDNFVHLFNKTSGCQSFDWRGIVQQEEHY